MNNYQLSINNYPLRFLPKQWRSVEEILADINNLNSELEQLETGMAL